jgi:eukaryotic-like serine/threonine-protein kinase
LRYRRVRANIRSIDLSTPAARRPDDTAPSLRGATGLICPRCRRRFEETLVPAPRLCPDDHASLIQVRDLADADGDPMLGRTLDGRYTVLAKLGAGSMGTVYRARQHAMGREVAIKILRSDRALDSASKGRFMREARANSILASAHTVTVFDFGESDTGELFLAMELLEGESLGQRLKTRGRLSVAASIETARQALRSLSEAHTKGIIHRDLKPDNLFFASVTSGDASDEIVKILDFGIAKMLRDDGDTEMNAVETQAGTVFGTPRYMSPEQAQGKPLDARSDLYSLGVILYHCLTGRAPFTDDDAIVVMARHIKTPPKPPSEAAPDAHIPPEIEAVVMRALAKEASQRPATAEAFAQELARARDMGAAGTSGVRVSVPSPGDVEAVTRGPSVPPPPRPDPRTDDSLDVAAEAALAAATLAYAPSRKPLIAALVGLVALLAIVVGFFALRPAATATAMTAPSNSSAAAVAPPSVAASAAPPPVATQPSAAALASSPPSVDLDSLPRSPATGHPAGQSAHPPRSGGAAPPTAKPVPVPAPPPTKYEKFE